MKALFFMLFICNRTLNLEMISICYSPKLGKKKSYFKVSVMYKANKVNKSTVHDFYLS